MAKYYKHKQGQKDFFGLEPKRILLPKKVRPAHVPKPETQPMRFPTSTED